MSGAQIDLEPAEAVEHPFAMQRETITTFARSHRAQLKGIEQTLVVQLSAFLAQASRLINGQAVAQPANSDAADPSVWRGQKRALFAELDADGRGPSLCEDERLSIEGTIRITDEIIADRDREIAELRALVCDQCTDVGSSAAGAAALETIFDRDEQIARQREQLRMLQLELQDKLRTAEIQISVERAKLTRREGELEERARQLADQAQRLAEDLKCPTDSSHEPSFKRSSSRGRWLARLGLNRDQEG